MIVLASALPFCFSCCATAVINLMWIETMGMIISLFSLCRQSVISSQFHKSASKRFNILLDKLEILYLEESMCKEIPDQNNDGEYFAVSSCSYAAGSYITKRVKTR